MTTPRQIETNRQNARESTGPRTPHGKAIVSQNAIRHGLYTATPVLPGIESSAAWEQHHQTTIASLAPVGQVETELAERIALILWRLRRVSRYERDVTSSAHRRSFADLNKEHSRPLLPIDTPEQARQRLTQAGTQVRVLTRFAESPPETPLSRRHVKVVLLSIDKQLGELDVFTFSAPEIAPDDIPWEDVPDWTVERLKRLVALIARAAGRDPEELIATTIAQARATFNAERARLRPYTRELADLRRARILPQPADLDQVIRYENHLTRQLEKTLAQLRTLQQDRAAADDPDAEADADLDPDTAPGLVPLRPLQQRSRRGAASRRHPDPGVTPKHRDSGGTNPDSSPVPSSQPDPALANGRL